MAAIPHLKMLAHSAVHLTQEPRADEDAHNKLVEIYCVTLLMASDTRVLLDHGATGPDRSGANARRHGLPGTGRARQYRLMPGAEHC